jgi:hypothetical protein
LLQEQAGVDSEEEGQEEEDDHADAAPGNAG